MSFLLFFIFFNSFLFSLYVCRTTPKRQQYYPPRPKRSPGYVENRRILKRTLARHPLRRILDSLSIALHIRFSRSTSLFGRDDFMQVGQVFSEHYHNRVWLQIRFVCQYENKTAVSALKKIKESGEIA